MLNRIVRLASEGLPHEADRRHAETLVLAGGQNVKVTPGATDTEPDYEATIEEAGLQHVRPGDIDGGFESRVLQVQHGKPHVEDEVVAPCAAVSIADGGLKV